MIGIVRDVNSDSAILDVSGVSGPVLAPFSEIKNATPKRLDLAELVRFEFCRKNEKLYATRIRILTGAAERDALNKMKPFAEWTRNARMR